MIEELLRIARLSGSKILEIYESADFELKIKRDRSPLTKADLVSNEIIMRELKKISDYPILTEESYVKYEIRRKWERFWLVDPLDGTKDFIARNGEFTINIALIEERKPILGVVYAPAAGLMYWAERRGKAYRNGKRIFNNSQRIELIGCDSRFHSSKETQNFFTTHNIKLIKRYGSALKFCKLAEGEVDVYPRFTKTKEWDTAAAHLIANEAGCKIVDIGTGEELLYNKEKIENNFFIASRIDLNFLV